MSDLESALSGAPLMASTPFRAWARHLEKEARNESVIAEMPAWESIADAGGLLIAGAEIDPSRDTNAAAQSLTIELSPATTAALLTTVPAAFHAGINDVLLAALAVAARRRGPLLVDLEGHGRETNDPRFDLSRTVGWFTTLFPVRLEVSENLVYSIKRVKEQLRAIPGNGRGYGLLRYLNPDTAPRLAALPRPQIEFNYLGRFDGAPGDASMLDADPAMPLSHLLLINAMTIDGSLSATWSWAPAHLDESDVRVMAGEWKRALESMARLTAGGHTPSDFALAAERNRIAGSGLSGIGRRPPALAAAGRAGVSRAVRRPRARRLQRAGDDGARRPARACAAAPGGRGVAAAAFEPARADPS
jgi:non-ribosomal peptide synthase protein (TIGR01720 family)